MTSSPYAAALPLMHGYTLGDLGDLSRIAVHTAGPMGMDWHERYDLAYSAIVEHLYSVDEVPRQGELVSAGRRAVYDAASGDLHHHGFYRGKSDGFTHGQGSSPAFQTYWLELQRTAGSPEARVVESVALSQIIPLLTPAQRRALLALAAHEDYQAAADALGLHPGTFKTHISTGRRRFFAHWHEGEQPAEQWGRDRRAGQAAGTRRAGGTAMRSLRTRRTA